MSATARQYRGGGDHKYVVVAPGCLDAGDAGGRIHAAAIEWAKNNIPADVQVFIDPDNTQAREMRANSLGQDWDVTVIYLDECGEPFHVTEPKGLHRMRPISSSNN